MSKEIFILFTGVGRRVELVQAFREAALCLNVTMKLYGADMTNTAPALYYCDFYRPVCGMREESYIDELFTICKNDNIDLVIPTIDTDLLVLSENKNRFEEIKEVKLKKVNDLLVAFSGNTVALILIVSLIYVGTLL